jgi:hypothetical protein
MIIKENYYFSVIIFSELPPAYDKPAPTFSAILKESKIKIHLAV